MTRLDWRALLALLVLALPARAEVVGYLAEFSDTVNCPGDKALLQSNKPKDLSVGDKIVTKEAADRHGAARALFKDRQTVLIGSNSELLIGEIDTPEGMHSTSIRMDVGRIRVFARDGTHCHIETPGGVVECQGTDFIVVVDPNTHDTAVLVISGAVTVTGTGAASGARITVHAYELTRIAPGQAPGQPAVPDQATANRYSAGLELVGLATSERMPFGNELLAGNRVLVADQPDRGPRVNPWGREYIQEEPGTIASPLFAVPGSLQVNY
jgi:hypothetical protein